jgi:hypothetical protein
MKEYEVESNGYTTTVLLSDEDAEAQGLSGGTEVDDAVPPDLTKPVDIEGAGVQEVDDEADEKSAAAPKTKKSSASNK